MNAFVRVILVCIVACGSTATLKGSTTCPRSGDSFADWGFGDTHERLTSSHHSIPGAAKRYLD